MGIFPSLPLWNAAHPMLVHFPIALLFVAPIFLLIGVFLRSERGRWFLYSALLLMVLGTMAAFVAKEAGEAAQHAAQIPPEARRVVDEHEEMGEVTVITFTALALGFAVLVLLPAFAPRFSTPVMTRVLPALFLLLYSVGLLALAGTAHLGGRLVHEYGIHAGAPAAPHLR